MIFALALLPGLLSTGLGLYMLVATRSALRAAAAAGVVSAPQWASAWSIGGGVASLLLGLVWFAFAAPFMRMLLGE